MISLRQSKPETNYIADNMEQIHTKNKLIWYDNNYCQKRSIDYQGVEVLYLPSSENT